MFACKGSSIFQTMGISSRPTHFASHSPPVPQTLASPSYAQALWAPGPMSFLLKTAGDPPWIYGFSFLFISPLPTPLTHSLSPSSTHRPSVLSPMVSNQGLCRVPTWVSFPKSCLKILSSLQLGQPQHSPACFPFLGVTVLCCMNSNDFKIIVSCCIGLNGVSPKFVTKGNLAVGPSLEMGSLQL